MIIILGQYVLSQTNENRYIIEEHKKLVWGTSLAVQWLRLHVPSAGGPGSFPGRGTRSRTPQ